MDLWTRFRGDETPEGQGRDEAPPTEEIELDDFLVAEDADELELEIAEGDVFEERAA